MITQLNEILVDGLDYMKRVQKNLNLLTGAILSKDEGRIAQNYNDLREGLQWVLEMLGHFENYLEIDFEKILVNKKSSKIIIEEYKAYILGLDDLYNNGKYNEVACSIELGLPKHLKNLTSIFNKIKTIAKEKQH